MTILNFVIIGLAAGMLSGMFGVGGGIIMVPLMTILLGFSQKMAQGTSLAAMVIPIGFFVGALNYHKAGHVHWKGAIVLALAMAAGAYLGSLVIHYMPDAQVQKAFGGLLVVVGIKLIFYS